ncbi:uncharacterized protein LOC132276649 [Cornus florida]|uniref:uncharacterized protein LOC132276649 n=1 Tax=Cornus florida TaxID=4283 RepID=UPI00289F1C80|nr:uncharacterized protein LOC132276649 [Cornus florida]
MTTNNRTMPDRLQTLEFQSCKVNGEDCELEGLEKLEAGVNHMAEKIIEYRASLPDRLKNTLASVLSSQRPVLVTHFKDGSEPGPSGDPNPGLMEPGKAASISIAEDEETAEDTQMLEQRISSNLSAMSVVLKRMRECISRIDNLYSCNGSIHPAFKRKKTS